MKATALDSCLPPTTAPGQGARARAVDALLGHVASIRGEQRILEAQEAHHV